MTSSDEVKTEDGQCEGEWCTQEVPRLPKIGWKERLLRWRDALVASYLENRLTVWHWARVAAVALIFIGAVGYAGVKAWRWMSPPQTLPVALPDKPKYVPGKIKSPASGPSAKAKPSPAGPQPPAAARPYNNQRTW